MSAFVSTDHPRNLGGQFTTKRGDAPTGTLVETQPDWSAEAEAEWLENGEQWAADAAAGTISEPDPTAGSADAWDDAATPF